MRNLLFFIFCFVLYGVNLYSQNSKKVLFIGNSYTFIHDIPNITKSLAESAGDNLTLDKSVFGGYTLELHLNNTSTINKIKESNWDHIVLQEQSLRPAYNFLKFYEGVDLFTELINTITPCVNRTLLYMTWGRQENWNYPYLHMQELTTNAYNNVAKIFDTEVAPVGVAWKKVIQERGDINLYLQDQSHQNIAGAYLAACVFYASIFDKSPVGISYYGSLDEEIATYLQNKAYEAYLEYVDNKLIHITNETDYIKDVIRIRNEDSEDDLKNKILNNNLETSLDIIYNGFSNNNTFNTDLKIEYFQNENLISSQTIPISFNSINVNNCNIISKKVNFNINLEGLSDGLFKANFFLNNNIVKEYNLEKNSTLGIENSSKENFSIFPLPAQNTLNIKLPVLHKYYKAIIYDINGRKLNTIDLLNKQFINLSIEKINSGVLFLKFFSKDLITTKKIIKQ